MNTEDLFGAFTAGFKPQGLWIAIGADHDANAYAWTEVLVTAGGVTTTEQRSGTLSSYPAYELNGSTVVPEGTIAWAWPSPAGDGLLFVFGGSGASGSASGSGGCAFSTCVPVITSVSCSNGILVANQQYLVWQPTGFLICDCNCSGDCGSGSGGAGSGATAQTRTLLSSGTGGGGVALNVSTGLFGPGVLVLKIASVLASVPFATTPTYNGSNMTFRGTIGPSGTTGAVLVYDYVVPANQTGTVHIVPPIGSSICYWLAGITGLANNVLDDSAFGSGLGSEPLVAGSVSTAPAALEPIYLVQTPAAATPTWSGVTGSDTATYTLNDGTYDYLATSAYVSDSPSGLYANALTNETGSTAWGSMTVGYN